MTHPRHHASTSKLSPDETARLRKMIARSGIGKTAVALRSTESTLAKLAEGPGLTPAARDRIAKRLAEVEAMALPAVIEPPSAPSVASARFVMVEAEGDAETVGKVLGLALAAARGM